MMPNARARTADNSLSFQPAVTYSSGGSGLVSLVVADVNGDGKPDIIVGNVAAGATSVGVLLGNGDGTFQPVLLTYVASIRGFNQVAVADVNGDGKPDLIVAVCCPSNGDAAAAVLLGNGDGTFQSPVTYDSGGRGATALVVADLNGDGKPDIAVTNSNNSYNSTVGVLLGNGDGTFQPALTSAARGRRRLSHHRRCERRRQTRCAGLQRRHRRGNAEQMATARFSRLRTRPFQPAIVHSM